MFSGRRPRGRLGVMVVDALREKASKEVWSLKLLRKLEWKRFELLCAGALKAAGYVVWSTVIDHEEQIDLVISSPNPADGGKKTKNGGPGVFGAASTSVHDLLFEMDSW